jgi:hypothetical protein
MYEVRITCGDNGFKLSWWEESEDDAFGGSNHEEYIQDSDYDELKSTQELLWWILEWTGHTGSKHDPERLRIVREMPDGKIKEG